MAFTEALKLAVKKKAHFRCCLCHAYDIEVHHIIPEGKDGPDTEENAAPLCGSCHNIYGGNPDKRKYLREARDHWYELCDKRFTEFGQWEKVQDNLGGISTKVQAILDTLSKPSASVDSVDPDIATKMRTLAEAFFNQMVGKHWACIEYLRAFQKVDPTSRYWPIVQLIHETALKNALELISSSKVNLIHEERQEITQYIASINFDEHEAKFVALAIEGGIPDEDISAFVAKLLDIRKT